MRQRFNALAEAQIPTRDLILDEAERLIAQRGVHGFTLKDIVDPLGIRAPSIYRHYESRDEILIAVASRYIQLLSQQYSYSEQALAHPMSTLRDGLVEYTRFHIAHPAYVRLALVDFSTPGGGVEYVRLAAAGSFRANVSSGPLEPYHRRLRRLIAAGQRTGEFRLLSEFDFIRVVKGSLMLRLVFPDDLLADPTVKPATLRSIETWLWDVAHRYIARRPDARRRSVLARRA
jgi:AcrR family transcriptional regulator